MRKTRLPSLLLCLAFVSSTSLMSSSAFAADPKGPPPGGKPPAPPQEAIDACNGLAENDQCEFSGRYGETITGQCSMPPGNKSMMACRPDHMPEGDMGMQPPPEDNGQG